MTVKGKKSTILPCILVFLMFGDLLLEMADMIIPVRHLIQMQVISAAGKAPKALLIIAGITIAVIAGYVLFRLIVSGKWEIRIFLVYVLWLVLTRFLNGDHLLRREFLTVMDILITFLMFASAAQLNEKQRNLFLSALVIIYCCFFVMVCITGLFVTITGSYLCIDPVYDIWIKVDRIAGVNSLVLFSQNTIICASWVYIALALLVYAFIRRHNCVLRILILLGIVPVFLTLPLFHSRTIQIVFAISCGMLALLILMRSLNNLSLLIRIPTVVFVTALALLIGFFSFNWSNVLVTELRSSCSPVFSDYYESIDNKADPAVFGIDISEEISGNMEEQRELSTNSTMTGRTDIWKSGFIAMRRDPSILEYGSLSDELMNPVNRILKEEINPAVKKDKPHMHNMFLQILMLTGIPGLLLTGVWIVSMVSKMIRFFFLDPDNKLIAVQYLTIPISGVIIWHLAEAGIFTKTDVFGKVFFFLCGILVSYYYDYFPAKTHIRLFRSKCHEPY